jgi:DNA-binding transcriptional LysR family regulator
MSSFSREIRSFLVVSQSESIRSAAEKLNISAPALSRQIQILERSYGTALLVRSAGGTTLTQEGEALRDVARKWMADDAAFATQLRQDQDKAGMVLRLGIMEGLIDTLIPPLVARLEAAHGVLELELTVGTTDQIVTASETSGLDLIVAFNIPRLSRYVIIDSKEYHLGAIHAPGFGPSGTGLITLAEALTFPLCLPGDSLSMHTRLLAEILSERINPRVCISSNSITALIRHMRAGKGIGFLTWPDVAADVADGKLVFRPIQTRRLTETLSIAVCRGNNLGDMTGTVVSQIQGVLEGIGK